MTLFEDPECLGHIFTYNTDENVIQIRVFIHKNRCLTI